MRHSCKEKNNRKREGQKIHDRNEDGRAKEANARFITYSVGEKRTREKETVEHKDGGKMRGKGKRAHRKERGIHGKSVLSRYPLRGYFDAGTRLECTCPPNEARRARRRKTGQR